jgi:DNA-binding transcriptional MerR regulator
VSLTVRDIAKRIARRPADVEVIVGRLRHWTAEGLLSPSGDKNPGTGRSRLYSEDTLEDAAILNALADMGLQIGTMKMALAVASQRRSEWGKAKTKKGELRFLQIDFRAGQDPLPRIHSGGFGGRFEKSIVLNLSELFGQLKTEKD